MNKADDDTYLHILELVTRVTGDIVLSIFRGLPTRMRGYSHTELLRLTPRPADMCNDVKDHIRKFCLCVHEDPGKLPMYMSRVACIMDCLPCGHAHSLGQYLLTHISCPQLTEAGRQCDRWVVFKVNCYLIASWS